MKSITAKSHAPPLSTCTKAANSAASSKARLLSCPVGLQKDGQIARLSEVSIGSLWPYMCKKSIKASCLRMKISVCLHCNAFHHEFLMRFYSPVKFYQGNLSG